MLHRDESEAGDAAVHEQKLSASAPELEQRAVAGVRALALLVSSNARLLHYVWVPPVAKPPERPADDEGSATAAVSAEHRAASARYLACAPPVAYADGRLPSCPLAWAVRRHRLNPSTLLYVRGRGSAAPAPPTPEGSGPHITRRHRT